MIFLRSLVFNILFYAVLAASCIISCPIGIISQKAVVKFWNYGTIPFLRKLLEWVCGLKIEVRGKEYIRQDGVIYAAKHQSAVETYTFSSIVKKVVFILKKELHYIPIFGWASNLYGMIPVDRGSGGAAMRKMLAAAKDRFDKGRPIIIFPEGTRTKAGLKGVYKPGILFIAENLNAEVIPVAHNTGLFWPKKSFVKYPGTIVFEFLPPLPRGLKKEEFMTKLEESIETKCRELNAEAVAKYPHAREVYERNVKGA